VRVGLPRHCDLRAVADLEMVRWVPPDPVAKDWDGVETAERRWRRARVRGGVRVVRGEIRRRLACRAAGAAAAGLPKTEE
jgi:hypothetical protein